MFNFLNQFSNTNGQNSNSTNSENVKINNSNVGNNFDNLQMARQDLMGELAAVIEYDNHIHKSNNEIAKETWEDIRDEELVHVGELLALIIHLGPYQKPLIEKGMKEFEDRLNNLRR